MSTDPRDLTSSDFHDLVNQTFDVCLTAGEEDGEVHLSLTLASCEDCQIREFPNRKRDPFSLIFHGSLSSVLPQGSYTLTHESLGTNTIFLVPIGPKDNAMQYQALFT